MRKPHPAFDSEIHDPSILVYFPDQATLAHIHIAVRSGLEINVGRYLISLRARFHKTRLLKL